MQCFTKQHQQAADSQKCPVPHIGNPVADISRFPVQLVQQHHAIDHAEQRKNPACGTLWRQVCKAGQIPENPAGTEQEQAIGSISIKRHVLSFPEQEQHCQKCEPQDVLQYNSRYCGSGTACSYKYRKCWDFQQEQRRNSSGEIKLCLIQKCRHSPPLCRKPKAHKQYGSAHIGQTGQQYSPNSYIKRNGWCSKLVQAKAQQDQQFQKCRKIQNCLHFI